MSEKKDPIIFIDSGIGGLTYLHPTMQKYPQEYYIYVADSANFPYGEKSAAQLLGLLEKLAGHLQNVFQPKAVVIACNTATLVAYDRLKQIFNCPVMGVKPMLTPETLFGCPTPIGILSTEASARQISLTETSSLQEISFHPASVLVQFIENYWLGSSKKERELIITPFVQEFQAKGLQTVMLSCTHFLYLKEQFIQALPKITFVDYLQEIEKVLAQTLQLQEGSNSVAQGKLYQTAKKRVEQYEHFANSFHLDYEGILIP